MMEKRGRRRASASFCFGGSRSGRPSSNLSDASRQLPLEGEPLAKRRSFTVCQSLPSVGNGDDRRQWRKQEGAVGAAASRVQATAKQTLGAATWLWHAVGVTERFSPSKKLPVSSLSPPYPADTPAAANASGKGGHIRSGQSGRPRAAQRLYLPASG